jgi:hypothetical protein
MPSEAETAAHAWVERCETITATVNALFGEPMMGDFMTDAIGHVKALLVENAALRAGNLALSERLAAASAVLTRVAERGGLLPVLMEDLGWQGGTVHQYIEEVRRLMAAEKARAANR